MDSVVSATIASLVIQAAPAVAANVKLNGSHGSANHNTPSTISAVAGPTVSDSVFSAHAEPMTAPKIIAFKNGWLPRREVYKVESNDTPFYYNGFFDCQNYYDQPKLNFKLNLECRSLAEIDKGLGKFLGDWLYVSFVRDDPNTTYNLKLAGVSDTINTEEFYRIVDKDRRDIYLHCYGYRWSAYCNQTTPLDNSFVHHAEWVLQISSQLQEKVLQIRSQLQSGWMPPKRSEEEMNNPRIRAEQGVIRFGQNVSQYVFKAILGNQAGRA